jgi:malonyl CoA-acyl carrier protein transacylase
MSGIGGFTSYRPLWAEKYPSVPTHTETHTALIFPGQGSQTSGMAAVAASHRPDLLEQAREELGADPFERIGEGTHFAQPALYCASLAHYAQAGSPAAAMIAGHSLGELAALVAAGALDAREGLRLAIARGRLMEAAAKASPGSMLAVLGGGDEVRDLAAELRLAVANDNAPGQVVLSGNSEAIAEARKRVRADGLKAIRLQVAGAFHSPLMESAVAPFRAALEEVELRPPQVPVFSSITAAPFGDVRADLLAALTEPVAWRATLVAMRDAGARVFLETGPGDVLTGLVRRTLPDAEAICLAEPEAVHV